MTRRGRETFDVDIFDEIVELIPRLPRDPDRPFPPPGAEDWMFRVFEMRTGLEIPPDLRRWLTYINGAIIGPGGIHGISAQNDYTTIEAILQIFPNWVEKGWFPVGSDGCGNLYVLTIRPEDGPGTPVFFIETISDPDSPSYVVASDLFHFLRAYFKEDLGEQGWPCDPSTVLRDDPALADYRTYPKCWEADDWGDR